MRVRLRSEHDSEIARLAIPALGTLVAEPLYVLSDTAVVGRIGTTELAGLALASTVLLTFHAILIFLAYGTTGTVSRLIGAKKDQEAAELSWQALCLAGILGTTIALALWPTGEFFIRLLGGSESTQAVLDAAWLYLKISLLGFPFMLFMLAGGGVFHGRQNTTTPLVIAIVSAVANLVIEVVLIFGFDYGLGASALATVIAQAGAGIAFIVMTRRWANGFGVGLAPNWSQMRRLLRTGKALVIRTTMLRGSFTYATAVAASIGVTALAAHQVANQVWTTLALALDAVAIAGQSLTGRHLGAGDAEKAKASSRRMVEIDVAVGVVAGLGVFFARDWVASLFSTDPDVVSMTAFVLIFVAIQQPINGFLFALDGVLIGAGDLDYLAKTVSLAAVIFIVAAYIVRATDLGIGWLWATIGLFIVVRSIAVGLRFRTAAWLTTGAP